MTLPNEAAGLASIGLEYAFTGTDGSVPGATNRTQSTITEALKQGNIRESPGWNSAHAAGYGDLSFGIPFVPNILFQGFSQLFDLTGIGDIFHISDLFDFMDGSAFLSLLIPGLDASKITSGFFPKDMILGLEDIPILGDIVKALTGSPGDLFDLSSWGSGVLDITSLIPYSHIGDAQPNLLRAPDFATEADMDAGWLASGSGGLSTLPATLPFTLGRGAPTVPATLPVTLPFTLGGGGAIALWSWDGTVGRTDPGSAKLVATGQGAAATLTSKHPVQVAHGQQLSVVIRAKWSGLVFTDAPVKVQFIEHSGSGASNVVDVAAPLGPSMDQSAWLDVSGSYTTPVGVDSVTVRLYVNSTVIAGTVWFDDGELKKTGLLSQSWTAGLPEDLGNLFTQAQASIDAIWQGITGFTDVGHLLTDVIDVLGNIPYLNVLGIGGPANIGDTAQTTWDQLISGFVNTIGIGSSLADLFNISRLISSQSALGLMSFDILGIRNNKSLFTGFSQTSQSNLNMATLAFAATAPTVPVTQSTALTSYHRIEEAIDVKFIGWTGFGITSITGFFVNLWQMDPDTGDETLLHHSADLVGVLSPTMADAMYDMPSAVSLQPGDILGIELHPIGAGTYNVVGDVTWRNFDHPTVVPRRWSSKRNAGSSTSAPASPILAASVDYNTTSVPFIEFGISSGNVALPHQPDPRFFTTVGSFTVPIPLWTVYIDRIAVGSGGGGQGCGLVWGEGGHAGTWTADTLTRGVDIPTGTTLLTINIPAGGQGGGVLFTINGLPGAAATVSATGASTLSAPGGAGGTAGNADTGGKSPGNFDYGGVTYVGGLASGASGAGNSPGGGGGGSVFTFTGGGSGGAGGVCVVFRQT